MSDSPRILAFAGSARKDSLNKKLVRVAARGAEAAGAKVTLVDLADYPMPIYDWDLQTNEGFPENVKKMKALFLEHDGLLISSPEYNGSIPPLLKNVIDWVSRAEPGEAALACYKGKVAALLATSPGKLGGIRSLSHVSQILHGIGVTVLPGMRSLPMANEAFDEDGAIKDEKLAASMAALGGTLADTLKKLKG